MVPLTVARLKQLAAQTGGDPADETTRWACMEEIVKGGGVISWPPSRNSPRWCGSGVKNSIRNRVILVEGDPLPLRLARSPAKRWAS
jgi:hypothetical protein